MSSVTPLPAEVTPDEPLAVGLESEHFPALPKKSVPSLEPPASPIAAEPSVNPWKAGKPDLSQPRNKFFLRFIPPSLRGHSEVGVCTAESISGELRTLDNTLVGFFLGKRPSFSFVRSQLLKQWRIHGSVEVLQLMNGGIAFRFSSIEDRDKVLENGIFYVGGQPVFLRQWERNLHTGGVMGLKRIPLWVTLPGLPLHLWGEESLSIICSVLGKSLFADRTTALKSRWAFARVCVEFGGDKPLLDVVTIEDDEGNEFLQQVKYEWRPKQCISCGVFGHAMESSPLVGGAAMNPEGVGKLTSETELKKSEILVEDSSFTNLLKTRTAAGFRNSRPKRVRKTNPTGFDPPQSHGQLQASLPQPESVQAPGRVSTAEGPLGGPPPCQPACPLDKAEKPAFSFFRKPLLNSLGQTSLSPSLLNRFQILESEADMSPREPPDAPSLTVGSSQPDLGAITSPDPSAFQPNSNTSAHESSLRQNVISRPRSLAMGPSLIGSLPPNASPNAQPPWSVVGRNSSPPSSPLSGGHTPYHRHSSSDSRTSLKNVQSYPLNPGSIFNSVRKNYRPFSSDTLKPLRAPAPSPPLESSKIVEEDEAVDEEQEVLVDDVVGKCNQERPKASARPLVHNSTLRVLETWED